MNQTRLDDSLILINEYDVGKIQLETFTRLIDHAAAKILGEQGLINCNVLLLDQGRYKIHWTSKPFIELRIVSYRANSKRSGPARQIRTTKKQPHLYKRRMTGKSLPLTFQPANFQACELVHLAL